MRWFSRIRPSGGRGARLRRAVEAAVLALAAVGAGVFVAALTPSGCAVVRDLVSPSPRPTEEGETAFGRFERLGGVQVLTLWGEPYDRGFAHGQLLARGIVDMIEALCGSALVLSQPAEYETEVLPLVARFTWTEDEEAELRGLYDGICARLGEGARIASLGRALTLDDLKAYNTVGDWHRHACSSFAAWGSLTEEGHVWVGRNFDFAPARAFYVHQMFIVRRRLGAKHAWATVSAPGLIGCISGVNEHGVFAAVHDVFLPLRPLEGGYTPRLLLLRRIMETCSAGDIAAQAGPILHGARHMFDNNILVAGPVADGTPPALVFEVDSDPAQPSPVTVRRAEDLEHSLNREFITCTNRYRTRIDTDPLVERFRVPLVGLASYPDDLMRRVVQAKAGRGEKVVFTVARKTMGAVRFPITVHTVVADLNTLDLWYASGEFLSAPGPRDFVKVPVREWLGPDAAAGRAAAPGGPSAGDLPY